MLHTKAYEQATPRERQSMENAARFRAAQSEADNKMRQFDVLPRERQAQIRQHVDSVANEIAPISAADKRGYIGKLLNKKVNQTSAKFWLLGQCWDRLIDGANLPTAAEYREWQEKENTRFDELGFASDNKVASLLLSAIEERQGPRR